MRYLLDTQIALWLLAGDRRLKSDWRKLIENNQCFLSIASVWEVGIKNRLGKLNISPQVFLTEMTQGNATLITLTTEHIQTMSELPVGHNDPFDLLMVAVATIEKMQLITADAALSGYYAGVK